MKKIFIFALLLFLLQGCTSAIDNTEEHVAFLNAITTYEEFLRGERSIPLEEDVTLTIAPNHGGAYTLFDFNLDGIPELVTNKIILQYRDTNHVMFASSFESGIYSISNDALVKWQCGGTRSFEILKNGTLLYEFEGLGGYHYIVEELDQSGRAEVVASFSLYQDPSTANNECHYTVNDSKISEEEWRIQLEAVLALKTELFPWNVYDIESTSNTAIKE